jgi:hypothetical protein
VLLNLAMKRFLKAVRLYPKSGEIIVLYHCNSTAVYPLRS